MHKTQVGENNPGLTFLILAQNKPSNLFWSEALAQHIRWSLVPNKRDAQFESGHRQILKMEISQTVSLAIPM